MTPETLSYLAGAMDSDGYLGIRKSSQRARLHDCINVNYFARLGLKQVTPQIPDLLRQTFGGNITFSKSKHVNRRPMYVWNIVHRAAIDACRLLLPYLRIKWQQAKTIIEFHETVTSPGVNTEAYWFAKKYPCWMDAKLITPFDASRIMGYSTPYISKRAVKNGTLLCTQNLDDFDYCKPSIPEALVRHICSSWISLKSHPHPQELMDLKERYFQLMRQLNQTGIRPTS